jgi:hypothetical protein
MGMRRRVRDKRLSFYSVIVKWKTSTTKKKKEETKYQMNKT